MAFTVTGGARIGLVNASWPLAQLVVAPGSIEVSGRLLGTYTFTPAQVVGLEPHGVVPFIARGIRIFHGRADYPANVVFWCFGSAEQLIARIHGAGFVPSCPSAAVPTRRGVPFRWSAVILAVGLWNGLLLLDRWQHGNRPAGPFALVALALVFAWSWGVLGSARLQSFVLREGRSVEEIRAFVLLLRLVTGLLLVAFSIEFVVRRAAG